MPFIPMDNDGADLLTQQEKDMLREALNKKPALMERVNHSPIHVDNVNYAQKTIVSKDGRALDIVLPGLTTDAKEQLNVVVRPVNEIMHAANLTNDMSLHDNLTPMAHIPKLSMQQKAWESIAPPLKATAARVDNLSKELSRTLTNRGLTLEFTNVNQLHQVYSQDDSFLPPASRMDLYEKTQDTLKDVKDVARLMQDLAPYFVSTEQTSADAKLSAKYAPEFAKMMNSPVLGEEVRNIVSTRLDNQQMKAMFAYDLNLADSNFKANFVHEQVHSHETTSSLKSDFVESHISANTPANATQFSGEFGQLAKRCDEIAEDLGRILKNRGYDVSLKNAKLLRNVYTVRDYGTPFQIRRDMYEQTTDFIGEVKLAAQHLAVLADKHNSDLSVFRDSKYVKGFAKMMNNPILGEEVRNIMGNKLTSEQMQVMFGYSNQQGNAMKASLVNDTVRDNVSASFENLKSGSAASSQVIVSKDDAQDMMTFAEKDIMAKAFSNKDVELKHAATVLHSYHLHLDSNHASKDDYIDMTKAIYDNLHQKIGSYDQMVERYSIQKKAQQYEVVNEAPSRVPNSMTR